MRHWAEGEARVFLEARGFVCLAENYATRGGEIDLVMRDGEVVVFVEVRQRGSAAYGTPGETIDGRKLARIRRAAQRFLVERFGRIDLPSRFDAVLVSGARGSHRVEHVTGIG